MKPIGQIIEAAMNAGDEVENPVMQLRSLIEHNRSKLRWLAVNKPDIDLSAKKEYLSKLDAICRRLEAQPPIEPWQIIWEKLGEAKREKFNGDLAVIYFPLKPQLPVYQDSRQVVIDLCGYNLNPYEYTFTGMLCRQFFTSGVSH